MYEGQQQGGDGLGPGGGKRGATIYGRFVGVYGNLLLTPLIGGSGGAGSDGSPGKGGGGGGGAILIGSNSKIFINGSIKANGSNSYSGGTGSGGAIRLIAPIVGGMGFLSTYDTSSGRIRIDCQDNQSYRSLSVSGLTSRGNRMIIFPEVIQRLNILEVAGQSIAENTASGVTLELPTGASTNQVVKVQARNFTNDVPIRVVVTPEHGSSGQFDATILQSSGNPPFANVNVVIPAGSVCKIHAWTR